MERALNGIWVDDCRARGTREGRVRGKVTGGRGLDNDGRDRSVLAHLIPANQLTPVPHRKHLDG